MDLSPPITTSIAETLPPPPGSPSSLLYPPFRRRILALPTTTASFVTDTTNITARLPYNHHQTSITTTRTDRVATATDTPASTIITIC